MKIWVTVYSRVRFMIVIEILSEISYNKIIHKKILINFIKNNLDKDKENIDHKTYLIL